jgi:hypothetical protein
LAASLAVGLVVASPRAAGAADPWTEALRTRDLLLASLNRDRMVAGLAPVTYDWTLDRHARESGADYTARCQITTAVPTAIVHDAGLRAFRTGDLQAAHPAAHVRRYQESNALMSRGYVVPRYDERNAAPLAQRAANTMSVREVRLLADEPSMMLFSHPAVPGSGAELTHVGIAVQTTWCAAPRAYVTIVSVAQAFIAG